MIGSSMRSMSPSEGNLAGLSSSIDLAVLQHAAEAHGRRGGDEVQVVLALEPLLDDLHVQQAQEPAAEAEPQRRRRLRLARERRVVEAQLVQRVAQIGVAGRVGREDPGEHHRLGRLEAGQRRGAGAAGLGDGVADARVADLLDRGGEEPDLAGGQLGDLARERGERADGLDLVVAARRHEAHLLLRPQDAVDDAHQDDHAAVGVVPAVEQQHAQRRGDIADGRRDLGDDRFEDLVDPLPFLGGRQDRVGRVDADHFLDLAADVLGIGRRQVDLVDDRDDREVVVHGEVDVGQRLRLDALRGIDDQHAPPRTRRASATPRSGSRRARACRSD